MVFPSLPCPAWVVLAALQVLVSDSADGSHWAPRHRQAESAQRLDEEEDALAVATYNDTPSNEDHDHEALNTMPLLI